LGAALFAYGADGEAVRPAATLLERCRGDAIDAGLLRREDDPRVGVVRGDVVVLGDQLAAPGLRMFRAINSAAS